MNKNIDTIQAEEVTGDLSQKERLAVLLGVFVLILVFGLATYIPSGPRKAFLDSQADLTSKQNELAMAKLMKQEQEMLLESQKTLMVKLKNRPGNFDLFSFMSGILGEIGLTDGQRAELENPRSRRDLENQPAVDLTLKSVSLQELVDLLHAVYKADNLVAVHKVDWIRPERRGEGLECKMTLVSLYPLDK